MSTFVHGKCESPYPGKSICFLIKSKKQKSIQKLIMSAILKAPFVWIVAVITI